MQFSGTVKDAVTHEPLYPANVALQNSSGVNITGVSTNPDGSFNFSVQNAAFVTQLEFSYLGYKPVKVLKQTGPYTIILQPEATGLPGATITATKYPTLKVALAVLTILFIIHLLNK